jgi:hypothetical protein
MSSYIALLCIRCALFSRDLLAKDLPFSFLLQFNTDNINSGTDSIKMHRGLCRGLRTYIIFRDVRSLQTSLHNLVRLPPTCYHTSNVSLLTQIPFAGPQVQIFAPFPQAGHFSRSIVHLIFLVIL